MIVTLSCWHRVTTPYFSFRNNCWVPSYSQHQSPLDYGINLHLYLQDKIESSSKRTRGLSELTVKHRLILVNWLLIGKRRLGNSVTHIFHAKELNFNISPIDFWHQTILHVILCIQASCLTQVLIRRMFQFVHLYQRWTKSGV